MTTKARRNRPPVRRVPPVQARMVGLLREVSTKDAKAHFSELVHAAAAGRVVTITRNGTPVAQLTPLPERAHQQDEDALLMALIHADEDGPALDSAEDRPPVAVQARMPAAVPGLPHPGSWYIKDMRS